MNNMIITFMGAEVPINVDSYSKGSIPILHKLPEDCEEGSPAHVEFTIETNNQLLNDILEQNYYDEIELLVLAAIELIQIDEIV